MRRALTVAVPVLIITLLGLISDGSVVRPAASALLAALVVHMITALLPGDEYVVLAGVPIKRAEQPVWSVLVVAFLVLCLVATYIGCALWAVGWLS